MFKHVLMGIVLDVKTRIGHTVTNAVINQMGYRYFG